MVRTIRLALRFGVVPALLVGCLCGLSAQPAPSVWASAGLSLKLTPKWRILAEEEMRTNALHSIDQYFTSVGLRYFVWKNLAVSANYRFIKKNENGYYFYNRHRYYADLSYEQPVGRIAFAYRARLQRQHKTYIDDYSDIIAENYLRQRLKLEWNVRGTRLTPAISAEVFLPLNKYKTYTIEGYRVIGGAAYPVWSKRNSLEIGLGLNRDLFPVPATEWFVALSFTRSFSLVND